MFNKILIANRGEIACRIMRTAHQMGIETIAVYSSADRNSLHVSQADYACCLGGPKATDSYLNIEAIIAAARESGAEAIHPGYGFLSENPHFARACEKAGLVFIGPSVAAMEAMASKQVAKQLLEKTSVPLTPGYHGRDQSDERLLEEAKKIGFPILLKAAAGGGGKGMRTVHHEKDFVQALASARREAKASFADDTMLIEKLISKPRHVEIQIMADNQGEVVHLFERDCSIQRRHQKIIEEAPAPNLSNDLRKGLADAAIAVAKAIHYRGAGTIEFLVDNEKHFYFMEMNTRLQVEHPVTEMITGLDLVEWQIRIAANEPLPYSQDEIHAQGHAIECRIYAEDPRNGFIPSIGKVHFLKEPQEAGLRIDSGISLGSVVTQYYDPMIAKLIARGENRDQALHRLRNALKHYHIGGIKTNIPFLQAIVNHPKFGKAQLHTDFLDQEQIEIPSPDQSLAVLMAACVDYLMILPAENNSLNRDTLAWQMHLKSQWISHYLIDGKQYDVAVTPSNHNELTLRLEDKTVRWRIKLSQGKLVLDNGKEQWQTYFENLAEHLIFYMETGPLIVERFDWQNLSHDTSTQGMLTAPMPSTVVAILKNKGDKIKAGECLVVLEAMKMEHTIHAPNDGLLVDIFYDIGAQVDEGAELVAMESDVK